jgi:hypothetical protein
MGLVLIVVGLERMFHAVTGVEFPWGPLLPLGLIALGLLVLTVGRRGMRPFLVLGFIVALASAAVAANDEEFLGSQNYRPAHHLSFPFPNVAVGNSTLDLRALSTRGSSFARPGEVKVGVGNIHLLLPEEMAIRIDGRSGFGRVDILGVTDSGLRARVHYEDPWFGRARHRLVIELAAGVGDVVVVR